MDELQFAAYCGDAEAVGHFLAQGADVKATDDFGYTALHWNARMACTRGDRVKILDLLVAAGSNVNHIDKCGNTVLDSAIEATAREEIITPAAQPRRRYLRHEVVTLLCLFQSSISKFS